MGGGFGGALAGVVGEVSQDPKGFGICLTLQAYLASLELSCLSLIGENVFRTYACSSSPRALKETIARGLKFHVDRKTSLGSFGGLGDGGQGLGGMLSTMLYFAVM